MGKQVKIEGTPEAWDSRQLGQDEASVTKAKDIDVDKIDEALELQMISIRLQKSLIDDLKMIAQMHGLGYQPLIRQILYRFADCEKKQLLRKCASELKEEEALEQDPPHVKSA